MSNNSFLIHSIKAIRYRFIKATEKSNANFGDFKISSHTRSPKEIVNHMCDLVLKTESMLCEGHFNSPSPEPLDFTEESKRFLRSLSKLENILPDKEMHLEMSERLLQGPILDMATHIGQLAMLNGINGRKVEKENYFKVDINP
ncbi:hypothetical protein LAG90_02365 [Marinilongibacter aquaticus]|uniref:hypothetical protein n=1 Tax=Marinilongibacter aquaticus TaxID=2975157 RepID=UPI0021BD9E63|nr:hypothetical protein [Marinilongibacter aquaticus]UBM59499.1 hypothetical protein LAG90_02365 [Marinilongibacter aquaticus]